MKEEEGKVNCWVCKWWRLAVRCGGEQRRKMRWRLKGRILCRCVCGECLWWKAMNREIGMMGGGDVW